MADMTDTLSQDGTDQATPEHDDTASRWDYFDPDEDTEETPSDEATDGGETDDHEEPGYDDETGEEETSEDEQSAQETFELANGETVTRDELLSGYLRQSDYTRKTTEVAQHRRAVQAEAQRINGIFESAVDLFTAMVPDPPDDSLARTNPGEHYAKRVAYENGLRAVQHIRDMAGKTQQSSQALTDDQMREIARSENARLQQFVPETATKQGREKFFAAVSEAAQAYGFTSDEMNKTLDSRIFRMAHDAAQWRRHRQAREKARAKVQKAAPAAPAKPGGKAKSGNREAMARLRKSGSIHDAVKVDWVD